MSYLNFKQSTMLKKSFNDWNELSSTYVPIQVPSRDHLINSYIPLPPRNKNLNLSLAYLIDAIYQ